jgi:hypothetical protein
MSLTLKAIVLAVPLWFYANPQPRTLALYTSPASGIDIEAVTAMEAEVDRLLAPAGLEVVWKNLASRKSGENFDLVAVSTFEGSCASNDASGEETTTSLADTSISDGRILPFFRVDCSRLVRMLPAPIEQAVLGRALARLVAHELYHIVAQTTEHQDKGVAKASFSLRDLTAPQFDLDTASVQRMTSAITQTTSFFSPLR